jgi:tripartite-type tricarboxylate transporter receptor subunit TctC
MVAIAAWAQAGSERYPYKPIRLIQPFPPGGGSDAAARYVGQLLSERLGQTIVVDNRGGAGGAIGTEIGANAPADGYTLLMATASTVVINPLLRKVNFDPIRDFDPVIYISAVPLIVVVHPTVPVKSVQELIVLAKSQPGKLNFASSGEGTISHLAGELFKSVTGTEMVHVPYRGGGPARSALIGGQVQLNFANMLSSAADVRAGRLRPLAVTTARRTAGMPEVPTMQEAGVANYVVVQWNGMLAPRGVPKAHIELINREINQILESPKTKQFFLAGGSEAEGGTPEAFGAFIRSDIEKWAKIVKQVRVKGGG